MPRTVLPESVDHAMVGRGALLCAIIYVAIYAFESPIRFGLNKVHLDAAVLARDLLIDLPLGLLFMRTFLAGRVPPAYWLFFGIVAVHGAVSYGNLHELGPLALGTKILINVLAGFLIGQALIVPGRRTAQFYIAVLVATVIGVMLEKYVTKMPWVGLQADIGGVQTSLSRDWQMSDPSAQRVGGFTKMSISAAALLGELGILCLFQVKRRVLQFGVVALTAAGMFVTTQKGSLAAFLIVACCFAVPKGGRGAVLRLAALGGLLLDMSAPFLTHGMGLQVSGGGALSEASLLIRIVTTWPNALDWIDLHQTFPLGVGIGSIGVSQLMIASPAASLPDNFFLFLYCFFGLPAFLYLGFIVYGVARSLRISPEVAAPALGLLAFFMLYGTVVSIVEDQVAALLLGAAVGTLMSARLRAAPLPMRVGHAHSGPIRVRSRVAAGEAVS